MCANAVVMGYNNIANKIFLDSCLAAAASLFGLLLHLQNGMKDLNTEMYLSGVSGRPYKISISSFTSNS